MEIALILAALGCGFDYAARDEILDGIKKAGLDASKVKYVILSREHGDHDGGAKLLQDSIPGVHLVYGAEDWDAVDKSENHMGGKPRRDTVGDDGMSLSVGDASVTIVTMPGHTSFNSNDAFYDRYIASSGKAPAVWPATSPWSRIAQPPPNCAPRVNRDS
jgi:metal-dependent hydrolase (beta-lactamase superfamily II)